MPFFINVLIMYAILVGLNIPAPFLNLRFENNQQRLSFEPPGFVIPIIWFVLFTLLGIAKTFVDRNSTPAGWLIVALAVLCATYAYYTLGLEKLTGISSLRWGLIGNIAVVAFALYVVIRLLPVSSTAAALVLPVVVWTCFATFIVIGQLRS